MAFKVLFLSTTTIISSSATSAAASLASAPNRPNILFLMADQMRWDTMNELYTPNLLKLRSRGLNMANTYTSTPSCTPARSALLTGLSPWYNGMLGYGEIAPQVSKKSRNFLY